MSGLVATVKPFEDYKATCDADPNLASVSSVEELHARLKELSIALEESDPADSCFKKIAFEGTNPNPLFQPNAYKANKGQDNFPITAYYRYAVKDEAQASKAAGNGDSVKAAAAPKAAAEAAPERKAAPAMGGARKTVNQLIELAKANDAATDTLDFSGQATFQLNPDAKITEVCEALAKNTHVTTLVLKDTGLGNSGVAILGAFLATNGTVTNIDLSNNKALKDEGAVALAQGLATNTGVLELNLMGLGGGIAIKSESICAAFIAAFQTNLTLKKPIWRLDHPLAHTLARLVTRNTSIARCISQGKPFESLLPDALKGKDVVVLGVASTSGSGAPDSA